MAGLQLHDDFIVGGDPNYRLTPNFRLREFIRPNGTVRVHRELVAALQILRERLGGPINIDPAIPPAALRPTVDGLGIMVQVDDRERLQRLAAELIDQGYLGRCQKQANNLFLEIPQPDKIPPIAPELAFECGLQVTAAFETSGDPYQQVTGNFDKAGLSFGPIQCNLKSGTLQELFRRLRGEDEQRLRQCFGNAEDYTTFWGVLDGPRAQAVHWADKLSTGSKKQGFAQPWKGYLQAVGREPVFRDVMLRYAYDKYGKLLMSALAFLRGVSPIAITNLRCLAALYDMGVQQGSMEKAYTAIRHRVTAEQPTDQFALTRIAVEERAKKASRAWRADCLSRRLSILERGPVAVSLDGHRARRDNPRSYLLRDSPVKGLERYLAT